jgi:hypothetical protein
MNTYSKSAELAGSVPSVNIATHNSRQKRYNSETSNPIYYLNHKDEFQIELYNPTKYVVRCDISLNGKKIQGGGLVLKPAERVFLDRYFDSTEKFLFETYEVGNTTTNRVAIELNGSVKVEFYKEQEPNKYLGYSGTVTTYNYNNTGTPYYGNTFTTTGGVGNFTVTATNTASTVSTNFIDPTSIGNIDSIVTSNKSRGLLTDSPDPIDKAILKRIKGASADKKIETGRVGKGSDSKQKFTNVHYDFDYFPFYTVEYKLLPYSQKPQTVNTVNTVRYCTECGAKLKPTFKFCANCGTKI